MHLSTDRILTTHAGSLPRGADFSVEEIVWAKLQALVDATAIASDRLW